MADSPAPATYSFSDMADDCAEVRRRLLSLAPRATVTLPAQRVVQIPEVAVAAVAGLSDYGD